jgi:hypothetical protein
MKDYCPDEHYFDEALTRARRPKENVHNGLTNKLDKKIKAI